MTTHWFENRLRSYPGHFHQRDEIFRYVMNGVPLSSFLEAVFCDQLKEAVGCADLDNQVALSRITIWMINNVPSNCQGSQGLYERWCRSGGLEGLTKIEEAEIDDV